MTRTHEQDVVFAREEISVLKNKYLSSLREFINTSADSKESPSLFLNLQQDGNRYFNYVEDFVGNSDLLGAHQNGRWVIGFAEDCAAILESLIIHFQFLRVYTQKTNPSLLENIEPSKTAYANMQRMVKEYLTKERSSEIKNKFESNHLPTYGFDNHKLPIMSKTAQSILSFVFGVCFVTALLIISFFFPSPSDFQYTVFRIILALAAGGVVAAFPGFIEVKLGKWLRAGGALAVFVLVYFYSPAAIEPQNTSSMENVPRSTQSNST
jgi:hypothetical protein